MTMYIFCVALAILIAHVIKFYPKTTDTIALIITIAALHLCYVIGDAIPNHPASAILHTMPIYTALLLVRWYCESSPNYNLAYFSKKYSIGTIILVWPTFVFSLGIFGFFAGWTFLDNYGKGLPSSEWLSHPQFWMLDWPISMFSYLYWTTFAVVALGIIISCFIKAPTKVISSREYRNRRSS